MPHNEGRMLTIILSVQSWQGKREIYVEELIQTSHSCSKVKLEFMWTITKWFIFCGSDGKDPTCNVEDLGSIPGLGRSPGEGTGYPLQYSDLENSMDLVHGITKSLTGLNDFYFQLTRLITGIILYNMLQI